MTCRRSLVDVRPGDRDGFHGEPDGHAVVEVGPRLFEVLEHIVRRLGDARRSRSPRSSTSLPGGPASRARWRTTAWLPAPRWSASSGCGGCSARRRTGVRSYWTRARRAAWHDGNHPTVSPRATIGDQPLKFASGGRASSAAAARRRAVRARRRTRARSGGHRRGPAVEARRGRGRRERRGGGQRGSGSRRGRACGRCRASAARPKTSVGRAEAAVGRALLGRHVGVGADRGAQGRRPPRACGRRTGRSAAAGRP